MPSKLSFPICLLGAVSVAAGLCADFRIHQSAETSRAHIPEIAEQKSSVHSTLVESYGRLPLSFEANQGQTDSRVKFLSRGPGYGIFLTAGDAVLTLHRASAPRRAEIAKRSAARHDAATSILKMSFSGANPAAPAKGLDELPGRSNYFLGNNPSKWRTGVPNYARVKYEGLYPGIDLIYYGNQRQLEFDLVLSPGADPGSLRLAFHGTDELELDSRGNLLLQMDGGEIAFPRPRVYQRVDGKEIDVDARYVLASKREAGFRLGPYDRTRIIVIDPVLQYATYLGGSSTDGPLGIAVDSAGNAYVAGGTISTDFPVTSGVVQGTFGGQPPTCGGVPNFVCGDGFVTKLNATGTALIYSTYLGGNDRDSADSIAVDRSGNVYIGGETQSTNFPVTAGAFQTTLAGIRNAFITKLNPNGSALIYSTLLGGSSKDGAFSIAIDSSGDAYVTGAAKSANFPITAGAFQTTCKSCAVGIPDAFVAEANPTGSALIYSTFLGGSLEDVGAAIAVDGSGNVYVTGGTVSTDFPTKNPIQATFAGGGTSCPTQNHQIEPHIFICGDVILTKLNATGSALVYSTYLGGSSDETALGIALDPAGNAYIAGGTNSTNFPVTTGALQTTFGGGTASCVNTGVACGDAFVAKINAAGTATAYSTYLGGANDDVAGRIAVDSSGQVHTAGITMSANFPVTSDAIQAVFAGGTSSCGLGQICGDAFVATLNNTGSALAFATYLGGSADDGAFVIAVDSSGNTYAGGVTTSTNFPVTPGSFQHTCAGGCSSYDAFVAKIAASAVQFQPASLTFPSTMVGKTSAPRNVRLTNIGPTTVTITTISITGADKHDFTETNNCDGSVSAGGSCTIMVKFKPTMTGKRTADVAVKDSDPTSPQMVPLSGTGS